jgi:hypothetical protein
MDKIINIIDINYFKKSINLLNSFIGNYRKNRMNGFGVPDDMCLLNDFLNHQYSGYMIKQNMLKFIYFYKQIINIYNSDLNSINLNYNRNYDLTSCSHVRQLEGRIKILLDIGFIVQYQSTNTTINELLYNKNCLQHNTDMHLFKIKSNGIFSITKQYPEINYKNINTDTKWFVSILLSLKCIKDKNMVATIKKCIIPKLFEFY